MGRWKGFAWLAAVLALKLAVFSQLREHPLLQPDAGLDTTAYADLARAVVAGNIGLGPSLYYVSPFYIYFLAAGLAVFDSFTAVRVLQLLLGTLSVGCIFVATREWLNERAAWVAAAAATLTGLFTFYESLILQASVDAFFTSAALAALTFGLTRRNGRWLFVAGLVFGVAALNRPNMPFGVAGIVLVLAVTRQFPAVALLVAGLLAGVAPVAIRNVVVARQWSFVSSHGGLNFYIGNNERATGFYRPVPGITPTIVGQEKDARRVAERAMGRPVTDAETSRYFFARAWQWIREKPRRAAALFARKLGYVFHAQHVALPHSYPFYAYDARTLLRFLPVGPWLLLPLGLVGLLIALNKGPAYAAWLAFVPGYAIGVAAFFVAERYRLPLLVPLCVGCGSAVDFAVRALRERRLARLAGPVVAFAVLAVLANRPLGLQDGRWEEGLRMAQRLIILGKYDEADDWVRKFEPLGPRPGATHHGAGAQLLVENQPARALPHLTRANELMPGHPQIEYDLAAARQATGDLQGAIDILRDTRPPEEDPEAWLRVGRLASRARAPDVAEPFFRRAVQLRPGHAGGRQQLGLNLVVLDRCQDAVRELSEAARLDPQDADTFSHLAYCELKLGDTAAARAHADTALSLDPKNTLAQQISELLRPRR